MIAEAANHSANHERYPWYAIVEGEDLEQGDIFESLPVFVIASPLSYEEFREKNSRAAFDNWEHDFVLITQSCDLVKDRPKVEEVLLSPIWGLEEFSAEVDFVRSTKGREEIRQGKHPGYHMLNASRLPDFERPIRLVDFHRIFSLPLDFLRGWAQASGPRLRLLPPYREHLGQAFARYFMRVGLPVDIPPFKK
jgi:hypothetical protein